MRPNPSRLHAALVHLAIGACIGVLAYWLAGRVWYPGPLLDVATGHDRFVITLAVTVVAGAVLTAIVFKPGKRGLAFDLWVIGIVQVLAIVYGVWAFGGLRPAYIAFVKDRFELATAGEVPDEALAASGMRRVDLPWSGPRLVGVRFPEDAQERFNLTVSAVAGADIQYYPRYHVAYDTRRAEVRAAAMPVAHLPSFNPGLTVERIARERGFDPATTGYLPMRAGKVDLTVFIDRRSGDVIDIARYKPWPYE